VTTLLLVEDDARIREALHLSLADEGYEVVEAATGEQALARIARDGEPDVVLLDLMLPGMDGIEVCAGIRALLRRVRAGDPDVPPVVELGDLSVRIAEGQVLRCGVEVPLTKTEFSRGSPSRPSHQGQRLRSGLTLVAPTRPRARQRRVGEERPGVGARFVVELPEVTE
jgi:DNA-binding response OmpR family regulator